MIEKRSYTRITLALDIIRKLESGKYKGFHELGIVKQKISLYDTIKVDESNKMELKCAHPMVPEDERNICWQAVELIKKEYSIDKNVYIEIDKHIPVQGGLAGGSTNAATVIELLDSMWKLTIPLEKKRELGKKLGMDVPFYFGNSCAYDTESTGVLQPINHSNKLHFLLVVPPFGVSTKEAYSGIDYSMIGQRTEMTKQVIEGLKNNDYQKIVENCHNDFEISVFKEKPALREVGEELRKIGADALFMSGSGSTMVGVFDSITKIFEIAKKNKNYIAVESI